MLLCLVFFAVLAALPEPFSLWKTAENVYRQFPFYQMVERKAQEAWTETDPYTSQMAAQAGLEYVRQLNKNLREEAEVVMDEPESGSEGKMDNGSVKRKTVDEEKDDESIDTKTTDTKTTETAAIPHPELDLSSERLADHDFLLKNFYIIDENTDISAVDLNAARFLAEDMRISKETEGPQILIYHSHSQETFRDSREGVQADSIVGVGDYLTSLLTEKYGYQVLHITDRFDLAGGELDRNAAYDYARERVEELLQKNPSIEVLIDLHRDGVAEGKRLVTQINGKDTAKIMFFNGISHTISQGAVEYLPNPYIEDNLAFSFQLEYQAALYYPTFYRGIYLAGLRYNLHLRPKSLLVEAGAQTNTVQEVKNAMEPLADILNRVLNPFSNPL